MTKWDINIDWESLFILSLIPTFLIAVAGGMLFIPACYGDSYTYEVEELAEIPINGIDEVVYVDMNVSYPLPFRENIMMKIAVGLTAPFGLLVGCGLVIVFCSKFWEWLVEYIEWVRDSIDIRRID